MNQPKVIDTLVSFDEDHSNSADGPKLIIKHEQNIPDEFVSQLKRDKIDTLHTKMGDFYRVATIPLAIVEKWDRAGFHIEEHSAHEIMAQLRKEDLDAFITTNKRI